MVFRADEAGLKVFYAVGILFAVPLVYALSVAMLHVMTKQGLVVTRTSVRQAPSSQADRELNERALEYQHELESKWLRLSPIAVIAIIAGVVLLVVASV